MDRRDKVEYTKGEWKAGKSPLGDWFISNGDTLIARYIRHYDARLIALAPVFYEALEEITRIEQTDVPYDKYDVLGAINIAKKAIAKVEG